MISGNRWQSALDYPTQQDAPKNPVSTAGHDPLDRWMAGRFTDVWAVLHPFGTLPDKDTVPAGQQPQDPSPAPQWLSTRDDPLDAQTMGDLAASLAEKAAAAAIADPAPINTAPAWSTVAQTTGFATLADLARALMTLNLAIPPEDQCPDEAFALADQLKQHGWALPADGYIVPALQPVALGLMAAAGDTHAIARDAMGQETWRVDQTMLSTLEPSLAQQAPFIPNSLASPQGSWLLVCDWDKPFSLLGFDRNRLPPLPWPPDEPFATIDRLDWWRRPTVQNLN